MLAIFENNISFKLQSEFRSTNAEWKHSNACTKQTAVPSRTGFVLHENLRNFWWFLGKGTVSCSCSDVPGFCRMDRCSTLLRPFVMGLSIEHTALFSWIWLKRHCTCVSHDLCKYLGSKCNKFFGDLRSSSTWNINMGVSTRRPSLDSFTTLRYWGSDFLEYLSVGIQVPSAETGVQGLGLKFGRLIPGVDFSVEDGNHMSTWNVSEFFWFLSEYKQKMHQSSTLPHVRSVNSTMIISIFGSARLLFHTSERKDQILSN